MLKRDKADEELNETLVRIANAIRGNPTLGWTVSSTARWGSCHE